MFSSSKKTLFITICIAGKMAKYSYELSSDLQSMDELSSDELPVAVDTYKNRILDFHCLLIVR